MGGVAAALYCGPVDGRWHLVATGFGSAPGGFLPGLFPSGLTLADRQAWTTGQNADPDTLYASKDTGRSLQPPSVPLPVATHANTWPVVVTAGIAPARPVIAYAPTGAAFVVHHRPPAGRGKRRLR